MHFPIIELTPVKMDRCDWIRESDLYDSPTIQYFTDYIGEEYTGEERLRLIMADYMKEFFDGIADVDVENQCLHFRSKDDIRRTLDSYYDDLVDSISRDEDRGMRFFHLRHKGYHYEGSEWMFVVNGSAYTSMEFIEDAIYHAGTTMYFGQVLDAHY